MLGYANYNRMLCYAMLGYVMLSYATQNKVLIDCYARFRLG